MIGNAQRPHRIGTVFTARPLQLFTRRQTATKAMRRVEHVKNFCKILATTAEITPVCNTGRGG
jgi:hypothetical protein